MSPAVLCLLPGEAVGRARVTPCVRGGVPPFHPWVPAHCLPAQTPAPCPPSPKLPSSEEEDDDEDEFGSGGDAEGGIRYADESESEGEEGEDDFFVQEGEWRGICWVCLLVFGLVCRSGCGLLCKLRPVRLRWLQAAGLFAGPGLAVVGSA